MKIQIELRSIGLASIGWGISWLSGADVPIFRRPIRLGESIRYEVVIPGSSFKGALRSAAYRIAEAYGFRSCGGRWCDKKNPCDVCALFGVSGNSIPSALKVSDFKPKTRAETLIVNRIRIDDSSMNVSEGGLFSEEYLPPGIEFSGMLELSGGVISQDLAGLLLLSLAELRLGRLGRHSLFDLRIDEDEEFSELVSGSKYSELLDDLRRWLWSEVL